MYSQWGIGHASIIQTNSISSITQNAHGHGGGEGHQQEAGHRGADAEQHSEPREPKHNTGD